MSDDTVDSEQSAAEDLDDLVNEVVQSIEAGADMRDVIHKVLAGALGEVERHEKRRTEVEGTFRQFLLDVCSAAGMWKDVVTGEDVIARLRELREREKTLIDLAHRFDAELGAVRLWSYPLVRNAESASVKEPHE